MNIINPCVIVPLLIQRPVAAYVGPVKLRETSRRSVGDSSNSVSKETTFVNVVSLLGTTGQLHVLFLSQYCCC